MEATERPAGHGAFQDMDAGDTAIANNPSPSSPSSIGDLLTGSFLQKLLAEFMGTYYLVLAGCASMAVDEKYGKVVTLPGIAFAWGFTVMVMIYAVGHVSGAHFNPAVTVAFAASDRFPWKQVPSYVVAQVSGSTLASLTLRLVLDITGDVCGGKEVFVGTLPSGSELQAFVVEFIITANLMFVISGVATDNRAVGDFAGLAIGSTVVLNILFAGPVTKASINPARSIGPALVWSCYRSLWLYIIAPVLGAVFGAWTYGVLRHTEKPLREAFMSGFRRLSCAKSDEEAPRRCSPNSRVCVLRVIDPTSRKYFICSPPEDSVADHETAITCKFE